MFFSINKTEGTHGDRETIEIPERWIRPKIVDERIGVDVDEFLFCFRLGFYWCFFSMKAKPERFIQVKD